MQLKIVLLLGLTLAGCASQQASKSPDQQAAGVISAMESRIVAKVIANLQSDLAATYPEYATTVGLGPIPAGWNTTSTDPLATDLFLSAYHLLERGVDTTRLSDPDLADIARLRFAAGLHADAVRFAGYPSVTGAEDPLTTMVRFLLHHQPADSEARLREYINRIDQLAPATAARLEALPAPAGNRAPGSMRNPCGGVQPTQQLAGSDIAAALQEDFATHLQQLKLPAAIRHDLIQSANDAIHRAIPAACDRLNEFNRLHPDRRPALSQLAGGEAYFQYLLRRYTGSTESSEAVYAMASASLDDPGQLSRMQATAAGTQTADAQEMLNRASGLVLDLDARRDTWTSLAPWADLDIRAMPESMALDCACTARYFPATATSPLATLYLDPVTPGEADLLTTVAANTIPGKHLLQTSRLGEVLEIPAHTEGWAIYSTTLLGEDTASRARQQEVFAKAVADIGLHLLGWPEAEAVRFLESMHLATRVPAATAVARILADPARAAAVAAGLNWFIQARQQSRDQLSDLAFNNLVLAAGPLPMSELSQRLARVLPRVLPRVIPGARDANPLRNDADPLQE
ncbi:MAG: DUF885 family protein [Pseudomonadota bacterium]